MPRFKLTIEYDGRPFVGWQIQDNGPTVQGALAAAAEAFSGEKVVIYGPAFPMNLTPLWVAHDKGFFREEGLDVTLEGVLGIPDAQHPRHQWRKEGRVVFASPGGSPMFRSVREKRGPEDSDINVISIADCTAHVFVAQPHIEDPSQLKGKRLGLIDNWLRHVQDVAEKHAAELDAISDQTERESRLAELNVAEQVTNVFRVTAGGSAVEETVFPGTEQEMVTLYFVRDGRLQLTHYCMAGNQPHMLAQPAKAA